MAQEVFAYYQKSYGDEKVDRINLPDFEILRYIGLSSFLNDARYPEDMRLNLVERIKVERPDLFEKLKKQEEAVIQQMEQQQKQQEEQPQEQTQGQQQ
jgi:hypothetical protein